MTYAPLQKSYEQEKRFMVCVLERFGVDIARNNATQAIRRSRARELLVTRADEPSPGALTWSQAFEQAYGVPLILSDEVPGP